MKPFAAVQPIFKTDNSKEPRFAGSSFRLWADSFYFTAAHCLDGLNEDHVHVFNCTQHNYFETRKIYRHASADLAIIEIGGDIPKVFEKFKLAPNQAYFGTNTRCFGLLDDWLEDREQKKAPGRVIAGIVQRTFTHKDHLYTSLAFEYSEPIPLGTSGGPAFRSECDDTVIGMAIGTINSSIDVFQSVEYEDDKIKYREKISEITRYGVILRLAEYREWIEGILPAVS